MPLVSFWMGILCLPTIRGDYFINMLASQFSPHLDLNAIVSIFSWKLKLSLLKLLLSSILVHCWLLKLPRVHHISLFPLICVQYNATISS